MAYNPNSKISGIAFVAKLNEKVIVFESFYDSDVDKNCLINQICSKYGVNTLTMVTNSTDADGKEHCMTRILNLYKFLDICAKQFDTLNLRLSVKDTLIAYNSGTYNLNNGYCSYNTDLSDHISIADILPIIFTEIERQCGVKIEPTISLML